MSRPPEPAPRPEPPPFPASSASAASGAATDGRDRRAQTAPPGPDARAPVLSIRGLSKRYPPNIVALAEANLDVLPGEVHCLLGANGAGKSTFLKLCAGAMMPSGGQILLDGRPVLFRSPAEAALAGIAMIYQELDLVPQMTVAENLFLGHAPTRRGLLDRRTRRARAAEALARVGASFGPEARVGDLSVANRQLAAIARSLTRRARVIIMDEPSAALNEAELEAVFRVIAELCAEGVAILYVSHRLAELRRIGDRVTVLRGGRTIETRPLAGTPDQALVEAVLGQGRALVERRARPHLGSEVVPSVDHLAGPEGLEVRGLELRRGEILGLTGLNGSGRTSFLRALFGDLPAQGRMHLHGRPHAPRHPRHAIRAGLGLVPEDRKTEGLILEAPIRRNAMLPAMQGRLLARHARQRALTLPVLERLSTRHAGPEQLVVQLSGGNQQKVVLARWLIRGARVLLLDEPSRGLDIGAKADLWGQLEALAQGGAAVIVASSELDELMAACDAIWVFHEGRNIARFDPATTDPDTILRCQILGARDDDD